MFHVPNLVVVWRRKTLFKLLEIRGVTPHQCYSDPHPREANHNIFLSNDSNNGRNDCYTNTQLFFKYFCGRCHHPWAISQYISNRTGGNLFFPPNSLSLSTIFTNFFVNTGQYSSTNDVDIPWRGATAFPTWPLMIM